MNISLTLTFVVTQVLVLLSVIGLFFAVAALGLPGTNFAVLAVLYGIWIVLSILVASALDSVVRTLLYLYAAEGLRPVNFNAIYLDSAR